MADFTGFQGLNGALELKRAFEEVNQRYIPTSQNGAAKAGIGNSGLNINKDIIELPIYYENGHPFAETAINHPGYLATLPDIPPNGTIIEYKANPDLSIYGVVTNQTKSFRQGVYVKSANLIYTQQLESQRPNIRHITIDSTSTRHLVFTDNTTQQIEKPQKQTHQSRFNLDWFLMLGMLSIIAILAFLIFMFI